MKIRQLNILLIICIVCGYSCRQKNRGPSWDVGVLAPILKTSMGLSNIVTDSLIIKNSDSSLKFVYSDTLFRLSLDTLVEIPDTTVMETFTMVGTIKLGPGEAIPTLSNITKETEYDLNGVELNKVILRSGTIQMELFSTIDQPTQLTYVMPGTTKLGVPFSVVEQIPASSSASFTYDLTGYEIDLRGQNGISYNTMVANIDAVISPAITDSANLVTGDKFTITYSFTNMVIEYARGYFGSYDIVADPTIDTLDIFKNITSGTIDLESVDLTLNIQNGFGIDAQIIIDTLNSINAWNGNSVLMSHSSIGAPINITRALDMASPGFPFTYFEYNIDMNTSNSNVEAFIENLPGLLGYAFTIKVNPKGNSSAGNDFLYYDSDLKVNIDIEMPLSFSANGLTLADTVDVVSEPPEEEGAESNVIGGFLYLYVDNGFPFEAILQIYLYNDNFSITDSLISSSGNIVSAAPVDVNYRVTNKLMSKIIIPIDEDKVKLLFNTKKALVTIRFTTKPDNQLLKIYSEYIIDLQLVGDFNYRIGG